MHQAFPFRSLVLAQYAQSVEARSSLGGMLRDSAGLLCICDSGITFCLQFFIQLPLSQEVLVIRLWYARGFGFGFDCLLCLCVRHCLVSGRSSCKIRYETSLESRTFGLGVRP